MFTIRERDVCQKSSRDRRLDSSEFESTRGRLRNTERQTWQRGARLCQEGRESLLSIGSRNKLAASSSSSSPSSQQLVTCVRDLPRFGATPFLAGPRFSRPEGRPDPDRRDPASVKTRAPREQLSPHRIEAVPAGSVANCPVTPVGAPSRERGREVRTNDNDTRHGTRRSLAVHF